MQTYEGSCHCGAVKYEVTMDPPTKGFSGNCSICSRVGWILNFVPAAQFKLLSGEDVLRDYTFNKHNTHHVFCSKCGVRSFSRGKNKQGDEMIGLNLRCVAGIDAPKLDIQTFDCKNL